MLLVLLFFLIVIVLYCCCHLNEAVEYNLVALLLDT